MALIENWRQAPRMLSVQAMALSLAIQGAWPAIPEDLKATLPPHVVHYVAMGLLIVGIIGRLVAQPAVADKQSEDSGKEPPQ